MQLVPRPAWRPQPMALAIAAAFCAAALVLYFQHRALSTLRSQTEVIRTQISEQTARDVAQEVRRTLDGPVFDTLAAVNHPELRAGRLHLVAREFEEGLHDYPQVDRFVAWTADTEAAVPGEALFFGRTVPAVPVWVGDDDPTSFGRDAALGRAVVELARRHVGDQHIYVAAENVGPSGHSVFLRLFWTDARRVEFFAVLGYVIDPGGLRNDFFPGLHEKRLSTLLSRRGGNHPMHLRVFDETGAQVYGEKSPGRASAVVTLPMFFYPAERIGSRLTSQVPLRTWRIEVAPPAPEGLLSEAGLEYWPTVLSIVLMIVAIGLTIQASRRATELATMQADFISHVSHQLKTPLSLLSAATETVSMDRVRSPEKLAQYLGIIRSEVTRLSALVQRILEFSRLQQARGYEFEEVDLSALVRETVAAFESSLAGQHFTFRVEESASPLVLADPAALEQALLNLLDNAVKYSGEVRQVTVRIGSSSAGAVVEVSDRGIGIPKGDQDRIFEKFYRGAEPSAHRPGFGLGLPIAVELVQAHRGRIEVESTPGEGSTFRIVLPSRAEREPARHHDETARPTEATP